MPSQINNEGNVVNVTANYLRTSPSTRFSTRQLQFFEISGLTGVETDPTAPNSLFSKAVRGVQAQAEVYAIGSPDSGAFMIVVADDTANNGDASDIDENYVNPKARSIKQAVDASTGGNSTVTSKMMVGTGFETGRALYANELYD
jgi:hypothetical protein